MSADRGAGFEVERVHAQCVDRKVHAIAHLHRVPRIERRHDRRLRLVGDLDTTIDGAHRGRIDGAVHEQLGAEHFDEVDGHVERGGAVAAERLGAHADGDVAADVLAQAVQACCGLAGEADELRPDGDGDVVTIADREAEAELTAAFQAATPGALIVGEEASKDALVPVLIGFALFAM